VVTGGGIGLRSRMSTSSRPNSSRALMAVAYGEDSEPLPESSLPLISQT
jgi:hypothetical protein